MEWEDSNILDIRYVKLHFTIMMTDDCTLPQNKVSALRGGMGEMLLRANCIKNRDCSDCDFEKECIVQRTMYSKFEKKPDSVNVGDSVGYVIECENYEVTFHRGEEIRFNLILFGKTIVYFNQYMQALFALGRGGLGTTYAKFQIISVKNTYGEPILEGNDLYMKYYQVTTLQDYVKFRLAKMDSCSSNYISFLTPTTIKHNGAFIDDFNLEAIVRAVQRRLYILGYFESLDEEQLNSFYNHSFETPQRISQEVERKTVGRHSNRKNENIQLVGIKGFVETGQICDAFLPYLLAGEITHIGKNTSFGFGKYRVR